LSALDGSEKLFKQGTPPSPSVEAKVSAAPVPPPTVDRCAAHQCRLPPVTTCTKAKPDDKYAPALVGTYDDCCALWHCTAGDGSTYFFHGKLISLNKKNI